MLDRLGLATHPEKSELIPPEKIVFFLGFVIASVKMILTFTDNKITQDKRTRVGTHVTPLVFLSYPEADKLCISTHLKEYITRTNHFRHGSKHLLLILVKPHKHASTVAITLWCKSILATAGVDVSSLKVTALQPLLHGICWVV